VFLQGQDADEVLAIIDRDGTDAAIEHLAGFDMGEETTQAALVNGYVYDTIPTGPLDHTTTAGVYTLTYNHDHGHVSLLRAPPGNTRARCSVDRRRGQRRAVHRRTGTHRWSKRKTTGSPLRSPRRRLRGRAL
jgi:hypothetical protein